MSNHRTIRLQSDNTVIVVKGHIGLNRDKETFSRGFIEGHIKGRGVALVLNYDHHSTLGSDSGRKGSGPRTTNGDIIVDKLPKKRRGKFDVRH
jgi:hypothetical protein